MDFFRSLQQVCTFFQLGTVVSCKRIPQGMSNPTFLIQNADNKEFVLRVLRLQTREGVENEFFIQKQLENSTVPFPRFLKGINGNYCFQSPVCIVTVSEKILGHHPMVVTEKICTNIGQLLAQFHISITNTQLPTMHRGWMNSVTAEKNLSVIQQDFRYEKIKILIDQTQDIFKKNLPKGIIHGDFIIENILFNSDNAITAVLDLEESDENILLLDIVKTICGVCVTGGQVDNFLAKAFLHGYNSIRRITSEENQNFTKTFVYIQAVCAAWFIKNGYTQSAHRYMHFQIPRFSLLA